jgi:hypothetical protein
MERWEPSMGQSKKGGITTEGHGEPRRLHGEKRKSGRGVPRIDADQKSHVLKSAFIRDNPRLLFFSVARRGAPW